MYVESRIIREKLEICKIEKQFIKLDKKIKRKIYETRKL